MATPTALPATFVASTVLPAADLNLLRGAFRILQVVQGSYSTVVSNSTTTMANTGLTATITPQYTSSKILVMVTQSFGKSAGNASNAVVSRVLRDSTNIMTFQGAAFYTGSLFNFDGPASSAIILDSPATVSATTYLTQFANYNASAAVSANTNSAVSTITLFEVSA